MISHHQKDSSYWDLIVMKSYQNNMIKFFEIILILIHFSDEQSVHDSEMFFIITENTSWMQNMYIFNDQMIIFMKYLKMRAIFSQKQAIMHFLSYCVDCLLFTYLICVKFFVIQLKYSLLYRMFSELAQNWLLQQSYLWH